MKRSRVGDVCRASRTDSFCIGDSLYKIPPEISPDARRESTGHGPGSREGRFENLEKSFLLIMRGLGAVDLSFQGHF